MRRVFLAGGSGVIGVRLIPLLVGAGHVVVGMTRSAGKAAALRSLGAEPVVCDVFRSGIPARGNARLSSRYRPAPVDGPAR